MDTDKKNPTNMNKEDDIKKFYESCLEYYNYIENDAVNNYNITFEELEEIFDVLLCDGFKIMYEGINKIIEGIEFYKMLFCKLKQVSTYAEFVDYIKFKFFDNFDSPHQICTYSVVEYCMKILCHIEWQICHNLAPRLRKTPEEAMFDALYPIESSQKEIEKIIKNFEIKLNKKIIS